MTGPPRWLSASLNRVNRFAREQITYLREFFSATRRGGQTAPSDRRPPAAALDDDLRNRLEGIGKGSTGFVLSPAKQWIRRHVETVQIKSASFGRRRLTIDIQLPIAGANEDADKERVYWIPIASLSKRPPRSNIDLRDEEGSAIALLTRDEDATISMAAVQEAAKRAFKGGPTERDRVLLNELIIRDGVEADIALAVVHEALKKSPGSLSEGEQLAFEESIRSMAGNSWIWLPLQGRPGERRVIKFHYDLEFERDRLRRRRPKTRGILVWIEESQTIHRVDLVELGDGNPRSALRRLVARFANATGLAAIELAIQTPYIKGSATYHMQVESPPAVETRGINLLAKLKPGAVVDSWHRDHGVHLYLAHAQIEKMLPAVVALRVGRRGFLTISWLTAVFAAAILWSFAVVGDDALTHREVTAAVLVVVPAILTALVIRPGEHPIATRLLFGVRFLVAACGLLLFAAAAAATEVKPSDWSTAHAWRIYAIAASIIAGFLTLSWVMATDTMQQISEFLHMRWRQLKTYRSAAVCLAIGSAALLTYGWRDPSLIDAWTAVYLAALLAAFVSTFFAATTYARVDLPPEAGLVSALIGLLSALVLAASISLVVDLISEWDWEGYWPWLVYASWISVGGLLAHVVIVRPVENAADGNGGDR